MIQFSLDLNTGTVRPQAPLRTPREKGEEAAEQSRSFSSDRALRPDTPVGAFDSTALATYVAARTVEDGDCLRWKGYCFNGHPAGTINSKKVLIRRALFEARNGPIPRGKVLRCTCETPLCVNEEHARLTTFKSIALECGAQGLMSGPIRSARIAEVKRAGKQAKISQNDARGIRSSDEPLSVVAARLGISISTASRIRRGTVRREFAGNPWAGLGA